MAKGRPWKLRITTINVNGLNEDMWRKLREIHAKRFDITFIQETKVHLQDTQQKLVYTWNQICRGTAYANNPSPLRTGGVAILLSHHATQLLTQRRILHTETPPHRYIALQATLNSTPLILQCIYAPAQSSHRATLFDSLPVPRTGEQIVEGDLNCYTDPAKDHKNTPRSTPAGTRNLLVWMSQSNLRDIWRDQHPKRKEYTSPTNLTRIDYILTTPSIATILESNIAEHIANSDHRCPTATLASSPISNTKPRWQLPEWVAPLAASRVKHILDAATTSTPSTPVSQRLENVIAQVAKTCKMIHTHSTLHRDSLITRARIRFIQHIIIAKTDPSPTNIANAWTARNQLNEILKETEEKKKAKAFDRHVTNEEKPTRHFFRRNHTSNNTTTIPGVQLQNGETTSDIETVIKAHRTFWEHTFSANGNETETEPTTTQMSSATENLPQLSQATKEELEKDRTIAEVENTINKLAPAKAAGSDGLRAEIFKTNANRWAKLLTPWFQELITSEEPLPPTLTTAVIILIYKKDNPYDPGNYRPIFLMNVIAKILTGTLNSRLREHLDAIIPTNQTGFVPRRCITENIIYIQDALHYARANCPEAIVACLDFAKAYDRVQWPYLNNVLNNMGFGPRYKKIIDKLYQTRSASIIINGQPTKPFKVTRGVQQGDPLSTSLFILTTVPLCLAIQAMDKSHGIPIDTHTIAPAAVYYADDTNLLARSPAHACELYEIAENFCKATGAKLNMSKCIAISARPREGCLPNSIEILPPNETTTILGIQMGTTITREQQIKRTIDKMIAKTGTWHTIGRTIKGKITIARSIIASTVWYTLSVLSANASEAAGIQAAITNYINKQEKVEWKGKNKRGNLPAHTYFTPTNKGGWRLTPIIRTINVKKIAILRQFFNERRSGVEKPWHLFAI